MVQTIDSIQTDEDLLEYVWGELDPSVQLDLGRHVLYEVEQRCAEEINSGNYDVAVPVSEIFAAFEDRLSSEYQDAFEDALPIGTNEQAYETAKRLIYRTVINALVADNTLLYVYDRQRVRSRVAEVARYFALLRQRFPGFDYEDSPSLSKMIKMHVKRRKQPKWGDEGTDLGVCLQNVVNDLTAAEPSPELAEPLEGSFGKAAQTALDLLWDAARVELGPSNSVADLETRSLDSLGLADYQSRALRTLLRQALTADPGPETNIVTASTGGGKTEAFLFPLIGYALTAAQGDLSGVKGILGYPRQDLCDDQFERLVHYLHLINRAIETKDGDIGQDPVTVALHHGSSSDVTVECPVDGCHGRMGPGREESSGQNDFSCSEHDDHEVEFVRTDNHSADIIVTTPDTLHRRLMDHNGRGIYWEKDTVPKFVVLDEVHVYSDQYGMHVANVMRRLQSVIEEVGTGVSPVRVAASATISNARPFTADIFGDDEDDVNLITPREDEVDEVGWEHIIFVKATDPRTVEIPEGNDAYRERGKWQTDNPTESNVTDLSTMIQVAFGLYHTMPKYRYEESEKDDKDRVLGFVDSIDSVSRLSEQIADAEHNELTDEQEGLFMLRKPDAFMPDSPATNPDCPKDLFRAGAADNIPEETAVCEPLPPNPHLNGCPVYEAGECWWTLSDDYLEPMDVYRHKSNNRETATGDHVSSEERDDWDMMIATSALEVGFDHESIIGTFQYRAPMSIPGFVQRKGRGGRDADDHPIAVVVLGSTPGDSFYFHHEELLASPEEAGDQYLETVLDAENEFVRTQHVVSSIFDYLNVQSLSGGPIEHNLAETIYKRIDMDRLKTYLERERANILEWLEATFPTTSRMRHEEVLDRVEAYVELTEQSLVPEELEGSDPTISPPGRESQAFWEEARIEQGQESVGGDLKRLNMLLGVLSMYEEEEEQSERRGEKR